MKTKGPPLVSIFFMTYFHRAGPPRPPDPLLLSQSQLRVKSKMWMDPYTASSTHDISSPAAGAMFYWIALLNVPQSAEPFLPGSRNITPSHQYILPYMFLYICPECQHIHYGYNWKHTRAPGCLMPMKELCVTTVNTHVLLVAWWQWRSCVVLLKTHTCSWLFDDNEGVVWYYWKHTRAPGCLMTMKELCGTIENTHVLLVVWWQWRSCVVLLKTHMCSCLFDGNEGAVWYYWKHTRAPGCFMATKKLCSVTIFIAILFSLK